MRAAGAGLLVVALVVIPGCGGVEQLECAPVTGKVTCNGAPMTYGVIVFSPEGKGRYAEGVIGPDGTYKLSTYELEDGAIIGPHRIGVRLTDEDEESGKKLDCPEPAQRRVEVKDGDNTIDVELGPSTVAPEDAE
jgi:hypothetical protein